MSCHGSLSTNAIVDWIAFYGSLIAGRDDEGAVV